MSKAHLDLYATGTESQRRGAWAIAELLRRVAGPAQRNTTHEEGVDTNVDEDADYLAGMSEGRGLGPLTAPRRPFAPHDVFAAIEKNDVDRIMAIRDTHFELLLGTDQNGVASQTGMRTPLEYAISLGPKYHRVCLFLVGALSRYVNHIPDDQPLDDAQLNVLRKVRANLKLAIDQSLLRDDTSLVASYLQVLVMAEGIAWLRRSVKNVAYEVEGWAIRKLQEGGVVPQPIQTAHDAVSLFLTSHLRMRRQKESVVVAAVDDYVANATGDLVLLALWTCLAPAPSEVPLYAFARDERCTTLFLEFVSSQRGAPPNGPAAKLWRLAERIETALHGGLHTPTSAERLTMLSQILR